MSKDIDQLMKLMIKNQMDLSKDIDKINKEIKGLNNKIELILEILNNFTIMILDNEEDDQEYLDEDNYQDNEGWVPEQSENWNSYEDDDLDG